MRRGPWHVFHFVGHGGFDPATEEGAIALSNDAGHMHLLRAYSLAELLDDHYPLRLVFLNSCEGARGSESDAFSSTAATLVRRGVPAVVAMQYEITDRAAIEFSRDFYEALADSLPVDAAVTEARAAVSMDSMLEWGDTGAVHALARRARIRRLSLSSTRPPDPGNRGPARGRPAAPVP
jgi:CHAT domain-containing protein